MIILRKLFSTNWGEELEEYKRWEKAEEKRKKAMEKREKKIKESKTPIYDDYIYRHLSKSQAKNVKDEDNSRKRLDLEPYLQKVEKQHGMEYKSLKRPIDYEDKEKIVEDFKKVNGNGRKVAGGTIGGALGMIGGMTAGALKTKNSNKAILAGLAGAGLGTLAGAKIGDHVFKKKDEKLIREALEERKRESDIKFGKRSKA